MLPHEEDLPDRHESWHICLQGSEIPRRIDCIHRAFDICRRDERGQKSGSFFFGQRERPHVLEGGKQGTSVLQGRNAEYALRARLASFVALQEMEKVKFSARAVRIIFCFLATCLFPAFDGSG